MGNKVHFSKPPSQVWTFRVFKNKKIMGSPSLDACLLKYVKVFLLYTGSQSLLLTKRWASGKVLEAGVKNKQIEKLLVVWVTLILRNACVHCSWSMSSYNSQLLPLLLKSQVPCIFACVRKSNITATISIYLLQTEHPFQRKRKANRAKPNRHKSTILLQPPRCIASDIIFTIHFKIEALWEILSVLCYIF